LEILSGYTQRKTEFLSLIRARGAIVLPSFWPAPLFRKPSSSGTTRNPSWQKAYPPLIDIRRVL
jgi:hypothetical protein